MAGDGRCRAWSRATQYRSAHRCENRGVNEVPYSGTESGVIQLCGTHLRTWRGLGGRFLPTDRHGSRTRPVADGPWFSTAEWVLYLPWHLAGPKPIKEET